MLLTDERIKMDIKDEKEATTKEVAFRNTLTLYPMRFEKDKKVILEFYPEKWNKDKPYRYAFSFYFSHPRFDLKQRDRHMLFRYVSPFE